jgi:hypothetical protein
MRSNPPIKGHRLLHEGHSVRLIDPVTDMYGEWECGCECGAKPGPDLSINGVKRWHRQHKANLRHDTQMAANYVTLADEFSPWSFTDHKTGER